MISVCPQKKINAKKSNSYGIRQHILEEMYADLKEIPGIHKALCTCNVLCLRGQIGAVVQWYMHRLEK